VKAIAGVGVAATPTGASSVAARRIPRILRFITPPDLDPCSAAASYMASEASGACSVRSLASPQAAARPAAGPSGVRYPTRGGSRSRLTPSDRPSGYHRARARTPACRSPAPPARRARFGHDLGFRGLGLLGHHGGTTTTPAAPASPPRSGDSDRAAKRIGVRSRSGRMSGGVRSPGADPLRRARGRWHARVFRNVARGPRLGLLIRGRGS
jgi:hypothetical protein